MPSVPRKLLEERFSQLADDLDACLESESACRVAAARRELAEWLNQAVRRLRQAANFAEIAGVLADSSSPFCNGAAVFLVNESMEGVRVRGLGEYDAARFASLRFPHTEAAAFAGALESGDPVVAMAGPAEVSAALVSLVGHLPGDRVALFPLQVRGKTAGVLYCWGDAQLAPLELLAHSGAAVLEALMPLPAAAPPGLVALEPAPAAPAAAKPELSPAEQRDHFRAQRFARVAVAEMRLYHAGAVSAGRTRGNLYAALRQEIEEARAAYRREFMPSPGMTDYLHQELLHALSNDDAGLLGENYPGPLV